MKQKRLLLLDIVFFITVLLLAGASAFSYRYITNLGSSANLVNHTNVVKLELEKILSTVTEAESAQRAYVLTKDSSFLAPMNDAERRSGESLSQLARLTNDNPIQQQHIVQLKTIAEQRLKRMKEVIASSSAAQPVSLKEGRLLMDQLRLQFSSMIREEETLQVKRERQRDRFVFLTPLYSLLFSVAAILIIAFIYSQLRKEIRLRSQAETSEATIHSFFMQVPSMLTILKGSDHRFAFANQPALEFIGDRDVIDKRLLEAMPELAGQGFDKLLDTVFATGEPFIAKEAPVVLKRKDNLITVYLNFVFQAYTGASGKIEGVMIFAYDVTEMIITRKQIEVLEERSRLAIEATQMGVFDWDLQNQQFVSSPRLLEIFGFKNDPSVTHLHMINRLHPEDKPIRDRALEASLVNGFLEYEARVVWPHEKSPRWVNVYGKVIYDNNNKALRMYGSVIDVTQKKNILEELKESESKFRGLSDSLTQQVWTTDSEGHLNYFNHAVLEYSGVNSGETKKVGWWHTIHPDEKQENLVKWENAVSNGQAFVSEHRLLSAKGNYRWHITRAAPQFNEKGITQMWVGTSSDIHEQKNFAEELEKKVRERTDRLFEKNTELKRSEEKYSTMVNEVEDYAILMLDRDGNIQNWNKGAEKIKGYSASEIIGKNFRVFYTKDEKQVSLPETLIATAIEHGKAENLGWRVKKDGSEFWANVVITALHDDKGDVIGFTKVTRDLTERKNAEEKQAQYLASIEQKNLELVQNNAELESFNYIASHDLQEPLRKIQAFSQLLTEKEAANLSATGVDYFNRITEAALRMQNLIEALINYSQTNSSIINLQDTDLNQICTEVKNDLSNIIDEKKALIRTVNLPEIIGDPVQLRQLFTNLISNAIKYAKSNVNPEITVTATLVTAEETGQTDLLKENNYWKIAVADNGIGFEQKYGHKIFELFQRLHGKGQYKGTGIGLAICKKIMRNHEGMITATGMLDVGAVFDLYFPVKKT